MINKAVTYRRRRKHPSQAQIHEQGLEVISVDPVQVFVHLALAELFLGNHLAQLQESGTLSPDQARQWWEHLQQADNHGTILISFTTFIIVGSKR